MSQRSQALLEPRKSPVQARSAASVDAILEATVQVLLEIGKERLTTTRVASRAGVSAMLASAREPLTKDPQLVASMLQGAMGGISRSLLESDDPGKHFETFRQEMTLFACSYLKACSRAF